MARAHWDIDHVVETHSDVIKPIVNLWRYLRHARLAVALTAPLIYACLIPFVLVDLAITLYQRVCFPIYGIPVVERRDYFQYDRAKLRYLNLLERMNCFYCSYANGLAGYLAEIAGRTEQHWCPIRHAQHPRSVHSRYHRFLPYRDATAYRERGEKVRHEFSDLP